MSKYKIEMSALISAYWIVYLASASLLFIAFNYTSIRRLAESEWLPETLTVALLVFMSGVFFKRESIFQSKRSQWLAVFAVLFLLASYSIFYFDRDAAYRLTLEDQFFEWLGAAAFLGTAIVFFIFSLNDKTEIASPHRINLLALLLAIVFFVGFGEEISWGQRVLELSTPDAIERLNDQGEMNLHNLKFQQVDADGEIVRVWNAKSLVHRLFDQFWFVFCVLIPVLNNFSGRVRTMLARYRIPVSPLWIGVFFVANHAIPIVMTLHLDRIMHHGIREVSETNFAILFFIVAICLETPVNRATAV